MKTEAQSSTMIKTRFAPSPTGYLHVGGARTALFCYLYARRMGGVFLLRIEDTDRVRSTQEAVDAILQGMDWLGLDYDEGPYYQTQHFERYQQVVQQLLERGQAYRCVCSKERIGQLRQTQQKNKLKPRYDGCCRDKQLGADVGVPFVVRFKTPQQGEITFDDKVHGPITFANDQLDDLVILRADGVPTYHLTVVVDDWDTQITHVIRGDDHINNTPRQIHLIEALGAPLPTYAHVPMILGEDGKRLSKRHGAVSVLQYREQGILPEALLNYLVRLGWSHGDDEVFDRDQMQQLFNLEHISHSPAAFDQDKLHWINQHYLKQRPVSDLAVLLQEQLVAAGIEADLQVSSDSHGAPALEKVVALQLDRAKNLSEMAQLSLYFYREPLDYDSKAQKQLTLAARPPLEAFLTELQDIAWNKEALGLLVKQIATQLDIKLGKLAQPLRAAITGGVVSPSIDATLELVGRERVEIRIQKAIAWIADHHG